MPAWAPTSDFDWNSKIVPAELLSPVWVIVTTYQPPSRLPTASRVLKSCSRILRRVACLNPWHTGTCLGALPILILWVSPSITDLTTTSPQTQRSLSNFSGRFRSLDNTAHTVEPQTRARLRLRLTRQSTCQLRNAHTLILASLTLSANRISNLESVVADSGVVLLPFAAINLPNHVDLCVAALAFR